MNGMQMMSDERLSGLSAIFNTYRAHMAAAKKSGKATGSGKQSRGQPAAAAVNRTSSRKKTAGTAAQSKKKVATRRKAVDVMSQFKGARLSDVSDKVFVANSPVHGRGLFAAKRIKADTVLGRLEGMPTFDDGTYVLWITDELGLELTNDFKYINHDKNPNAAYSDLDVTVLRDVEPGEELLHDYGWE